MNNHRLVFIFLMVIICGVSCFSGVIGTTGADIDPTQTNVVKSVIKTDSSQKPSPQPSPSSTPDPYHQVLPSPNESYIAKLYSLYKNSSYIEAVEIWDSKGELVVNIPYQGDKNEGDPRDAMRIAGWSSDSKKLFFFYSYY